MIAGRDQPGARDFHGILGSSWTSEPLWSALSVLPELVREFFRRLAWALQGSRLPLKSPPMWLFKLLAQFPSPVRWCPGFSI